MKLRLERKFLKFNEDVDFPDFAFDFALNYSGDDGASVYYLLPSSKEDIVKAQASEISAHLMGRYK